MTELRQVKGFEPGKVYGVLDGVEIVSTPMLCVSVADDGSPTLSWALRDERDDHTIGGDVYPADPPPFTGLFGGLMFAEWPEGMRCD